MAPIATLGRLNASTTFEIQASFEHGLAGFEPLRFMTSTAGTPDRTARRYAALL